MNYKKIYKSIIQRAKQAHRTKASDEYYESHHIIPNFMFKDRKDRKGPAGHLDGDCDAPANLVLLTIREHFFAHLLLVKIHAGTRYENSARKSLVWFFTLLENSSHPREEWFALSRSKKYERYRKLAVEGIRQSMTGTMLVKDKTTGEKIGRVSVEHEKVLSGEWVHWSTGRKNTKEQTVASSLAQQGMKNSNARPDITSEDIVTAVVDYCVDNNKCGTYLRQSEILQVIKSQFNASVMILKNRIDGGIAGLVEQVNNSLAEMSLSSIAYNPYLRDKSQRAKLAAASSGQRWVTDGKVNRRTTQSELQKFLEEHTAFFEGRTL